MKQLLAALLIFSSFTASAQKDTLVTNTIQLDGSTSNDNGNINGGIIKYQWEQISGEATTIRDVNTPVLTVVFSNAGIYQYQLTVTNKAGLTNAQAIQVTVLPGDAKPKAIIIAIPVLKLPPQK